MDSIDPLQIHPFFEKSDVSVTVAIFVRGCRNMTFKNPSIILVFVSSDEQLALIIHLMLIA